MEPRIEYAKTKDGVSIAFWTLGEGMPLVWMQALTASHLQLEWQWPEWRGSYERLAEKRRLVRYDGRGHGLSDRDVSDYSLDALVLDLEAVVDRLGLERFALLGVAHTGPVAITYAVRHPERVSHLLLWCTYARALEFLDVPAVQPMRGLVASDWDVWTETAAHNVLGWSEGDQARRLAALMRESVTPEAAQAALKCANEFDVADVLSQVRSSTLVLHRRQFRFPDVGAARGLASRIPDARLVVLEGESLAFFLGETESVAAAIDEFLGEGEEAATVAETPPVGTVHTILFTDMESSTALTQRLGDARAQELLRTHNAIVRSALSGHGGSEIKHTGDGIMASFPSASGALECAVAIQQAVEGQAETPLRVRIGLNAGEPVAEEQDLFGTAVQLARRVCDRAEPGEILASDVVRQLAAGKGFLFSDRGDVELRGFEDPVRLYEVRWRD